MASKVDTGLVLKAIFVAFIIMSPFLPYARLRFLNNLVFKVCMLFCILAVCFYDFQLAIIITIAFMLLVLNLNQQQIASTKSTFPLETFADVPKDHDDTPNEHQNIVCPSTFHNDINNDMMNHFIDDKIKPYDVFIRMMTDERALASAQGNL